jgi:hypothetical protein
VSDLKLKKKQEVNSGLDALGALEQDKNCSEVPGVYTTFFLAIRYANTEQKWILALATVVISAVITAAVLSAITPGGALTLTAFSMIDAGMGFFALRDKSLDDAMTHGLTL